MRTIIIFAASWLLFGCTQEFGSGENLFADSQSDLTITVPVNSGFASEAELLQRGQELYADQCSSCHGSTGAGEPGSSILNAIRYGQAITHTWQSMPPQTPSSCGQSCSIAVIAWVAQQNDIDLNIQFSANGGNESTDDTLEPLLQTYQRASTLFGQALPTSEELASLEHLTESDLRTTLKAKMSGEGFRNFIKDGANDQLLVRGISEDSFRTIQRGLEGNYINYQVGIDSGLYTRGELAAEFAESPLELIYYVVANERPYSEVLTADYVMVSQHMAYVYETGLAPAAGEWLKSTDKAQRVSGTRFSAGSDWDSSRLVDRPDAGLLTSWAFTARYPTTDTNRNRARAKQVMLHFLGYDIEASAPRLELSDAENFAVPTMESEACTVCHDIMDPIAGTFQNFADKGIFNQSRFGLDSLSNSYKSSDLYQTNDTWYRDMLAPGYYGEMAPDGSNGEGQSNSVVWLAQQLVNDERFASGIVKFWWPAVFGREFHSEDLALIEELSAAFRNHWNLKDLLVDMVMSDTYRRGQVNAPAEPAVVTPELMAAKYESLGGLSSSFAKSHHIFFGGHDSWASTERERDINAVMVNVLKNNAYKHSCRMVYDDFALPYQERVLFSGVELDLVAGSLKRFKTPAAMGTTPVAKVSTIAIQEQSRLSIALRGVDAEDSYVTNIKLETSDGTVVFDGPATQLQAQGGALVDNGVLSGTMLGFRNDYHNALLTLPALPLGTSSVDLTIEYRARYNDTTGAAVWVEVIGDNPSTSFASEQIKMQLVDMAWQIWGEQYDVTAAEINELYQLFSALQRHAQVRGETDTQFGNVRCEGVGDIRYFDLDYTFSAWKGVLAAMLSDASFLLN